MVNIVNPIFDIPNQNQILSNDIAIGMPRVPNANLNYPVNPINNTNIFDPKYHSSKRYNPNSSISENFGVLAFGF